MQENRFQVNFHSQPQYMTKFYSFFLVRQLDIAKIVMIGGNLDSSVVPADCLSDQETIKLQV